MNLSRAIARLCCIALAAGALVGPGDARAARRPEAFQCQKLGLVLRPAAAPQAVADRAGQRLTVVKVRDARRAAGIRRGDVILALDGKPVRSPQELCQPSPDERAAHLLLVERDRQRSLVPVIFQPPALRWSEAQGDKRSL